ncbi:MAG: ATP-binding protein [Algicola sp.]|nr:ATP-binding protein [Algicola sp.]
MDSNSPNDSVYVHKLTLSRHPFIKDVCIDTHQEKKHIIITGQNGVGKSTFLGQIKSAIVYSKLQFTKISIDNRRSRYFKVLDAATAEKDKFKRKVLEKELELELDNVNRYSSFCDLEYDSQKAIDLLKGDAAIQAFFNAKRTTKVENVESVRTAEIESTHVDQPLSHRFKQHLVNSRSQLAFARDDGDESEAENLNVWFIKLDEFMSDIFECPIKLRFDRKALDYKIESKDGTLLDFNHLSEGYAAIINIVTEIIMRMEVIEHGNFTLPGIVMIDEIETHLHVKLQKKIMRLLTTFFPNIQFIVTTHSPFVLTSLDDAVVFDMETNSQIDSKEDLWQFSFEDIIEGYFDTETHSLALESKIERYEQLSSKDADTLAPKENKELLLLKNELKDVPTFKLADIELRLQALGLK